MESVQSASTYAVMGGDTMPTVTVVESNKPSQEALERWHTLIMEVAVRIARRRALTNSENT